MKFYEDKDRKIRTTSDDEDIPIDGILINVTEDSQAFFDRQLKNQKIRDVNTIIATTTSGKVFDGDEKSQDRMIRAIRIAEITGETTTMWKLFDNTVVDVTLDELKEAVSLAGKQMSNIWLGD